MNGTSASASAPPQQVTYLGDGVYAIFDGCGVLLKANSLEHPTDQVYLEPAVFTALTHFMERVRGTTDGH